MSAIATGPGPGAPRLAIRRLLDAAPVDEPAVDAFLEQNDFPLVEGSSVTFVATPMHEVFFPKAETE